MFATDNSNQPLSVLLMAKPSELKEALLTLLLKEPLHLITTDDEADIEIRFQEQMPDLVILLHDEQTDAFELQGKLKERWGCRAHCVIIGGRDERTDWEKALQLGLIAYLPAPVDLAPLADILSRMRSQVKKCVDTSRKLLDASRLTRILDALPFGVILLGAGERIMRINKSADELLGQAALTAVPHCLEELLLLFFGPSFDEPLIKIRSAIAEGRNWQETVFIGKKLLTMKLVILADANDKPDNQPSCLLSVQDLNHMLPAGDVFKPTLAAATFDLLSARHLTQRELSQLTSLIIDNQLPSTEVFDLGAMLEECRQNACLDCVSPVTINMETAEQLPALVSGYPLIIRETIHALLEWAAKESGNGNITFSITIHGKQEEAIAIRFRIDAVERRLTRSSYRSAEEQIADEFARNGNLALKQLRGIGLASLLTARLGSGLLMRNVAREGKQASFDLWLKQVAASALPVAAKEPVQKSHTTAFANRQELSFLLWDNVKIDPEQLPSLRILVAEDNLLEQRSLQAVLTKLGHSVVIVNNGREAVEELEQNSYDLLLLDILMPIMDGFEAIRLIREKELRIGHYTPVMALTSYTLKAVQERCARAGMNGYLAKPVTAENINLLFEQLRLADNNPVTGHKLPVLAFAELEHDKELYQDMLELFKEHGLPMLVQLDQLLSGDLQSETVHQLVHKLKGMAANIGAKALRQILHELDEQIMQNQQPDCRTVQAGLKNATEQLLAAMEAIDWQSYPQTA